MFNVVALAEKLFAAFEINGVELVRSGASSMITAALGSPDLQGMRGELVEIGEKLAARVVAGLPIAEADAAQDLLRIAKTINTAMSILDSHSVGLATLASQLSTLAAKLDSAVIAQKAAE